MSAPILSVMRREVEPMYLAQVADRTRQHLARGVRSSVKGQLWERVAEGRTR